MALLNRLSRIRAGWPQGKIRRVTGVRSIFGSSRTIAAPHHQRNQALATRPIDRILCAKCGVRDRREIKWLSMLGVPKNPFIDVIPIHSALREMCSPAVKHRAAMYDVAPRRVRVVASARSQPVDVLD